MNLALSLYDSGRLTGENNGEEYYFTCYAIIREYNAFGHMTGEGMINDNKESSHL